jgi:hypothetical protein
MPRVRIGLTCKLGHFNEIGWLWEPISDKEIDKLAERARVPVRCEQAVGMDLCARPFIGLPHVENLEREVEQLARVGGQNVRTPLQSRPKAKPQEGPLSPSEWKRQVFERQRTHRGGPALCAVTGESLYFIADDAHHVLDKSLLRQRELFHLVWDARNGLAVKSIIHAGHTSRMRPIPRSALLPCNWEFAREIGPWAVARLEEKYP